MSWYHPTRADIWSDLFSKVTCNEITDAFSTVRHCKATAGVIHMLWYMCRGVLGISSLLLLASLEVAWALPLGLVASECYLGAVSCWVRPAQQVTSVSAHHCWRDHVLALAGMP